MENPKPIVATIGSYADFIDTGIWTLKDGKLLPSPDLTARQMKDFGLIFGEFFEENNG